MANTTIRGALVSLPLARALNNSPSVSRAMRTLQPADPKHNLQSIHGTNPQYLIEKVIRSRIYEANYWSQSPRAAVTFAGPLEPARDHTC